MQKKHWLTIARVLALVVVIGISVFVYSIRDQVEEEVLQIAMDYLCNGRSQPIRKDKAEGN